jgi:pyruvate kinase
VADVAHAVAQGIDTLMLTGETAIGRYPVKVVRTLREIIETIEEYNA